jgi:hypothetical protein
MKHDIAFSEEIRVAVPPISTVVEQPDLDPALVGLPLDVGVESPQSRGNL